MTRLEVFGFFLALCYVLISADEQYCAWYGECGIDQETFFPRTCVAKNKAQPINNPTAEAVLMKKCPHFFQNGGLYIEVY